MFRVWGLGERVGKRRHKRVLDRGFTTHFRALAFQNTKIQREDEMRAVPGRLSAEVGVTDHAEARRRRRREGGPGRRAKQKKNGKTLLKT